MRMFFGRDSGEWGFSWRAAATRKSDRLLVYRLLLLRDINLAVIQNKFRSRFFDNQQDKDWLRSVILLMEWERT